MDRQGSTGPFHAAATEPGNCPMAAASRTPAWLVAADAHGLAASDRDCVASDWWWLQLVTYPRPSPTLVNMEPERAWTTEFHEGGKFEVFFLKLKPYEQAVVQACIEQVLNAWGKISANSVRVQPSEVDCLSLGLIPHCAVWWVKSLPLKWVLVVTNLEFSLGCFAPSMERKSCSSTMDTTKARTQARSAKRKKSKWPASFMMRGRRAARVDLLRAVTQD